MTAARRQAGADDGGMSAAPGGSRRDVLLALLLGAVSVAAYLLYPVLNHGPGRIFLRAPLDRAIPLIILAAIVAAAAGLRRFQAFALAITLALAVSYLIYALAQSYVIRPSPAGTDWLTAAVRHVYSLDRPYNDFPSLHTSLSAIVAVSWWRIHRRTGIAIALWCTLIIASTVLIHQHYLADIAGGLAVAGLALAASDRIIGAIHHDQAGRARTQGQGRSAPGRRLR
jgi:membrane-associated phospholipid phosphatase